MYRFRSSDITNDKFLAAVERHGQIIIDRYHSMDIRELREIIYHSDLSENMYNNLMFALTVSDSFVLPSTKTEADVLFFVLQVNYAFAKRETKIRITNVSQAYMYIQQSGGHFREILRENEPETIYTTFQCYTMKVPYVKFMWSIPITRIMDGETKKPRICLAGVVTAPYAMLSFPEVGIQNLQVPRMYYAQLFSEQIAKGNIFADERNVRTLAAQQMTEELCTQILSYCGFKPFYNIKAALRFETTYGFDGHVFAEIRPIQTEDDDEDLDMLLLEDRDFKFSRTELENDEKRFRIISENSQLILDLQAYWKRRNSTTYQFLSDAVQYIPIFARDDFITIWLAK